jgi:hypothetical protein
VIDAEVVILGFGPLDERHLVIEGDYGRFVERHVARARASRRPRLSQRIRPEPFTEVEPSVHGLVEGDEAVQTFAEVCRCRCSIPHRFSLCCPQ